MERKKLCKSPDRWHLLVLIFNPTEIISAGASLADLSLRGVQLLPQTQEWTDTRVRHKLHSHSLMLMGSFTGSRVKFYPLTMTAWLCDCDLCYRRRRRRWDHMVVENWCSLYIARSSESLLGRKDEIQPSLSTGLRYRSPSVLLTCLPLTSTCSTPRLPLSVSRESKKKFSTLSLSLGL